MSYITEGNALLTLYFFSLLDLKTDNETKVNSKKGTRQKQEFVSLFKPSGNYLSNVETIKKKTKISFLFLKIS